VEDPARLADVRARREADRERDEDRAEPDEPDDCDP
jgi:hypothetical protein